MTEPNFNNNLDPDKTSLNFTHFIAIFKFGVFYQVASSHCSDIK